MFSLENKLVNIKYVLIATLQLDEKYGITRDANVPVYDPGSDNTGETVETEFIPGTTIPYVKESESQGPKGIFRK